MLLDDNAARLGAVAACLALAVLALAGVMSAHAASDALPPPSPGEGKSLSLSRGIQRVPWTRTAEPVVIGGASMPQFEGVPLSQLLVYQIDGSTWSQIPFQFDEVDASGTYTVVNGLLDPGDELALMAGDVGERALASQWVDDADSRNYPRYELHVTNPLDPAEQGWLYVYRSATLTPQHGDYVSWDPATNRVLAGSYVAGFDPATHAGVDSLELNGTGVDVLDRTKLRVKVTCWVFGFPIPYTFDENDLAPYSQLTPNIDGAVRVGGGTSQGSIWLYGSRFDAHSTFDLSDLPPIPYCTSIDIDAIRGSADWLNPFDTGMAPATYFDDNRPNGVAVDGVPDDVPAMPPATYQQVSGELGSVVGVVDVSLDSGTLSTYYLDQASCGPTDTGDGACYGDAGFQVDEPSGQVGIEALTVVLEPGEPNVGPTYELYEANPLQVATAAQSYQPPEAHWIYLPLVSRH